MSDSFAPQQAVIAVINSNGSFIYKITNRCLAVRYITSNKRIIITTISWQVHNHTKHSVVTVVILLSSCRSWRRDTRRARSP